MPETRNIRGGMRSTSHMTNPAKDRYPVMLCYPSTVGQESISHHLLEAQVPTCKNFILQRKVHVSRMFSMSPATWY